MLKSPFPWFGGKSRVSNIVWRYFGNTPNYVEPFAGSLATLLGRLHDPHVETVNDLDCYLSNFWRALKNNPCSVIEWADYPVHECDLHARHEWLVGRSEFRRAMHNDPDFYDCKIAGWWLWGICSWIGAGWCAGKYYRDENDYRVVTKMKIPSLGNAGRGINRTSLNSNTGMSDYMYALANRLRNVRVCCGDWKRVLSESVTVKNGVTSVFLDPPYSHDLRDSTLYGIESDCSSEVRKWAIENGDNPLLRISLCGYSDEHVMPDNWSIYRWKAHGGFANQSADANKNAEKETIWFSQHCLSQIQPDLPLFSMAKYEN